MARGKDSKRWDIIAVVISILSLVASLLFSSYSLILANQANSLTEKSLNLQNFASIIAPNTERIYLEGGGSYSVFQTESVHSFGQVNITLTIITPHYGNVTLEWKNFTPSDPYFNLDPYKINQTRVSSTTLEYSKPTRYVVSGLNTITFDVDFDAWIYPNRLKLDAESLVFIGGISLKSTLFDAQSTLMTTKEFHVLVFVETRRV